MEFLSEEWCRAVTAAAPAVTNPAPEVGGGAQPFTVRLELVRAEDHPSTGLGGYRAWFEAGRVDVQPLSHGADVSGPDTPAAADDATVTLVLDPDTAIAVARGVETVASAMTAGRVKVRGPVSLLIDHPSELAALAAATRAVAATVRYPTSHTDA